MGCVRFCIMQMQNVKAHIFYKFRTIRTCHTTLKKMAINGTSAAAAAAAAVVVVVVVVMEG